MKKFLIINLFLSLIFVSFINAIYAVTVTDNSLSANINEINSILENKIDTTNPNYLTEIVDENGNVPAYTYYPNHTASRSIKELKAYDGKIFMGLGDWNDNTGPVKVLYYDTTDGKVKTSGTINDEAIQIFNIIDDKIYTTGCDPRDAWGYGSYYIYNKGTNTWDKHMKNDGWIHVFNIVEFKDKLYMCGSTVDTMERTCIQGSSNNGETFQNIPVYKNDSLLPYDSNLRCYNLAVYNDKLYGYIGYTPYNGIYEYDEVNNRFDYISNIPSSSWYNSIYFEYTTFNDQFIYISGTKLYTSTDLKTFTKIDSNTEGSIRDAVVYDDILYALSYEKISAQNYTARIYSTKDLSNFSLVYEFLTETQPFSIEYYANNFYIGTRSVTSTDNVSKNGSLYRINLTNAKKSININTNNKAIEIFDNGKSYSVEYDLSSKNPTFKTTLTFDNTMDEEQWKQEYSNIRNLNLVFAAIANSNNIDFDKSTAYFNNILFENNPNYFTKSTNAVDYAKEIFEEELNIQDDLFTLTTVKISETENEYKTQVTLTIKSNANFNTINPNTSNPDDSNKDSNNNVNNSTGTNTNTNTNINNNTNTNTNTNINTNNNNTNTNQNNNSSTHTVSAPSIKEVLIIPPSKTNYNVGEKLDLTGLKITVIYPNNTIKEITKDYTIKGYSKNKSGLQTVTISYKGFSRSYNVRVRNTSTGDFSSSNTTPNTNINNNINSEINNFIDNSNNLSQNENNLQVKDLLVILVILSIILVGFLIIRTKKYKKE